MKRIINWILALFESQTVQDEPKPLPEEPIQEPIPMPPATNKNRVVITRQEPDNGIQTVGELYATRRRDLTVFTCKTLELAWKNNAHNISCIPKGIYQCSKRPFYATFMYQVLNVLNRKGIFFHVGNYWHDVLGCIILGASFSDINHDGQIDISSSKPTVAAFMAFFGGEDFELEIK